MLNVELNLGKQSTIDFPLKSAIVLAPYKDWTMIRESSF